MSDGLERNQSWTGDAILIYGCFNMQQCWTSEEDPACKAPPSSVARSQKGDEENSEVSSTSYGFTQSEQEANIETSCVDIEDSTYLSLVSS